MCGKNVERDGDAVCVLSLQCVVHTQSIQLICDSIE